MVPTICSVFYILYNIYIIDLVLPDPWLFHIISCWSERKFRGQRVRPHHSKILYILSMINSLNANRLLHIT